jgi:hypothetical protein
MYTELGCDRGHSRRLSEGTYYGRFTGRLLNREVESGLSKGAFYETLVPYRVYVVKPCGSGLLSVGINR